MEGTVSKYIDLGFECGGRGGRFIEDDIDDVLDKNDLDMVGYFFRTESGMVSREGYLREGVSDGALENMGGVFVFC